MASNDSDHSKVLKRLRPSLIRELPDPLVMLDSPELKGRLSGYEKSQISSPSVLCERAEMFINVIEFTSNDVFQLFLVVLKRLKPELGDRLERAWREVSRISANGSGLVRNGNGVAGEERLSQAVQEVGGKPQNPQRHRVVEDAGIFGLNGYGPGPAHHLSHLSYNSREYLASRLNGTPPERNNFHAFCHALEVEDQLIRISARSGNPTGYLLQKYSTNNPDATLEKLERALTRIGMGNVFQNLMSMQNGGGPEDD